MKVLAVINSKAGSVNAHLVEKQIREALFRCDLRILIPTSLAETKSFLLENAEDADGLIICGGDGTVNTTIQLLLKIITQDQIPPICIVRSGTANDLAIEMGVSQKITQAARLILEGQVKFIDLIEVSSKGQKAVMMTNGGLGIPAETAQAANRFRQGLRDKYLTQLEDQSDVGALQKFKKRTIDKAYTITKKAGAAIYPIMALNAVRKWDNSNWELELELDGEEKFQTKASSILVNNQPFMGKSFCPAPFTSNSDGVFNVLVTDAQTLGQQIQATINLMQGRAHKLAMNKSYETKNLMIKSLNKNRQLSFFGDGEILLQDVDSIQIKCCPRVLPIFVHHHDHT